MSGIMKGDSGEPPFELHLRLILEVEVQRHLNLTRAADGMGYDAET